MLYKVSLFLGLIFLLIGAFFLYDPVSGPDSIQTMRMLGGATLVSLGLITILLVAKDWLDWRRKSKNAPKRHQS
jgi:hypothetical protein